VAVQAASAKKADVITLRKSRIFLALDEWRSKYKLEKKKS